MRMCKKKLCVATLAVVLGLISVQVVMEPVSPRRLQHLARLRLHRYGRLPPVHPCPKHMPSLPAHLFVEKSSVNAEVGLDAPVVMGLVQLAMIAGTPFTSIRDAISAHPTIVQGLNGRFSKRPSKG